MSVITQEQMLTDHHIKLLDFWSTGRFVWLEHGLNLLDEDDQLEFLARIERDHHLVPANAAPVDVTIEYLFTQKRLVVQDISPGLRLHPQCTRGRLMHLARVAHERHAPRCSSVPTWAEELAA